MKWAALQVVFLVLVLVASNSACAMTCSIQPCHDHSSAPPCHQKHDVKTCDHVLPVADVVVAVVPAPDLMVADVTVPMVVRASWTDARGDWSVAFSPGLLSIPILRI
jgi:hypothetical protein